MNTIDRLDPVCWVPTPAPGGASTIALVRAWIARTWVHLHAPMREDDDLAELDAHVLADIGAPEPLMARAMARREARKQEREGLRLGLASGAWQHW